MKQKSARAIHVALTTLACLAFACAVPLQAEAQINCANLGRWSATVPPVNQIHIFCGEWNANTRRPSGFHSRPGGLNPATVTNFGITQAPNAQGIYGGTWTYAGAPAHNPKFSTMFPDSCSQAQVLESILHALMNPTACPPGSPNWWRCGSSGPGGGNQHCSGTNDAVFTIALGVDQANGNVNTAFPLR
jgi:hypothetical protein